MCSPGVCLCICFACLFKKIEGFERNRIWCVRNVNKRELCTIENEKRQCNGKTINFKHGKLTQKCKHLNWMESLLFFFVSASTCYSYSFREAFVSLALSLSIFQMAIEIEMKERSWFRQLSNLKFTIYTCIIGMMYKIK